MGQRGVALGEESGMVHVLVRVAMFFVARALRDDRVTRAVTGGRGVLGVATWSCARRAGPREAVLRREHMSDTV